MFDASSSSLASALEAQLPFLSRLARALVADEHAAEDLVQETVASALAQVGRDAGQVERGSQGVRSLGPGRLRAWLSTVLRRNHVDRLRAFAPGRTASSDTLENAESIGASPDGIAERLEHQRLLHSALASLPEEDSLLLVLRFQDGLSAARIAATTDTPLPTVKSRIQRALERLRGELDRQSGGDADARERWLGALATLALPCLGQLSVSVQAVPKALPTAAATTFMAAMTLKYVPLVLGAAALLAVTLVLVTSGPDSEHNGIASPEADTPPATPRQQKLASAQTGSSRQLEASRSGVGTEARAMNTATDEGTSMVGPASPVTLLARVISATSRKPVAAHIRFGEADGAAASPIDGAFALELGTTLTGPLQLSHPRFKPLVLSLKSLKGATPRDGTVDLGILEMTPKTQATLTVLDDDGAPLVGAECQVHRRLTRELNGTWGPGPQAIDEARSIGSTDDDGRVTFPLAYDATVTVKAPGGRMGAGLVAVETENIIRIDGPARRVVMRFADSGQPVAGRFFPVAWQGQAADAGWYVRTDSNGVADLPVGAGTLTLCMSKPRLLIDAISLADRPVKGIRAGSFSAVAHLLSDETEVEVIVACSEVAVHLIDADTREPVIGTAYFMKQSRRDDGQWSGFAGKALYHLVDGTLTASAWFTDPQEGSQPKRRWIAVPGYKVKFLDGSLPLAGATVALDPAHTRSLRVVDSRGRPVATPCKMYLACGVSLEFVTDLAGFAGPFPWSGEGGWRIYIAETGFQGDYEVIEISAAELASAPTVTVRSQMKPGAIRIVDIPHDAPPIFALSRGRLRAARLMTSQGTDQAAGHVIGTTNDAKLPRLEAVIEGLAPDGYIVGSHTWVSQLSSRLVRYGGLSGSVENTDVTKGNLRVQVTPGSVVDVPWNPSWRSVESTTGRVICEGHSGDQLAVMPIYAALGTQIYFGSHGEWRYCDAEGRFRTVAGDPDPLAFLIARFVHDWGGRHPVVLDSQRVRADGVYHVALTSFELVASNAQAWAESGLDARSYPTLWLVGDSAALDAPMEFLHGVRWGTWNPAEPREMSGLPAHISTLRLTFRGGRERQLISIRPGGNNRIAVHIPLPSTPARPVAADVPALRER